MVQYVFTPWRDRRELLRVREQFYPDRASGARQLRRDDADNGSGEKGTSAAAAATAGRQDAVDRVSMWMQRGGCPLVVESTALLTAAVLSDEAAVGAGALGSGSAVRAAYAAAFGRYVFLPGCCCRWRYVSFLGALCDLALLDPRPAFSLRHALILPTSGER